MASPGHDLSKTEREALKAIHRITVERRRRDEGDEIAGARTGDLSHELGLTPGTITLTLKRLAEQGHVNHHPYHGVTLTEQGTHAAIAAIRRHRVVERFLSDQMNYSWQDADRLAPIFEHALPPEIEARMYEILAQPATCPHGFPIPEPHEEDLPNMETLYDLDAGANAVVAVPGSLDKEVVDYLLEVGLRPGVEVSVIENRPYDGLVSLDISGAEHVVGERVARQVFVRRIDKEKTA